MRRIARILLLTSVAIVLALPLAGCNASTNEESMAGTKGTAGPNPPTSQKEFYEQQKAPIEPKQSAEKSRLRSIGGSAGQRSCFAAPDHACSSTAQSLQLRSSGFQA